MINQNILPRVKKGIFAALAFGFLLGQTRLAHAQDAASTVAPAATAAGVSIWSSPLFWVFVVAILGLLLVIVAMGGVLISLVNSKLGQQTTKVLVFFIALFGISNAASAQTPAVTVEALSGGLSPNTIVVLMVAVAIEVFVILYLYNIMQKMLVSLGYKKATENKFSFSYWYKNLTKAIPVEKESEVETDHNYDGIRELDNSLPPWWVYMFYATIVFSVVYVFYYHFSSGPSQEDEYQSELALASQQKTEQLKNVASNVDENTVVLLAEAADISKGKSSFITKCAACHGQAGEGGVGPNLTDEYWIHGGGVKNIFKTIKYGVQEKGMIAWQTQMQPLEMQQVTSYIMSLAGTKPANAKEPQGDLYVEEAVTDSAKTTAIVDSTATTL